MNLLLDKTLREFDRINSNDPRTQIFLGTSYPRELIFAQRVYEWVTQLNPSASEAVRLAARSHTILRWEVDRNRYPKNTVGYHEWRAETARHSARAALDILSETGYTEEIKRRVSDLITWRLFPQDTDAQLLEDADCLSFLEIKLADYLNQWGEVEVRRILQGTWKKMSPPARQLALGLPLDQRIKDILR